MTLTYLDFLAAFVFLPLGLLGVGAVVRPPRTRSSLRFQAGALGLLVVLALAYTTPWDNYLIARGVWWYGDGTVSRRLWLAPLGEYLFIAAQTILVGLWTFRLVGPVDDSVGHSWRDSAIGVGAGLAVAGLGVAFLVGPQATYYLGAILLWAGPVLALQWGVGWRYLLTVRRRVAGMVAVPVLYLSTVDRVAIQAGVWTISPDHTTGLAVLGLPVEEGAFFLCTTVFLVQALVLLRWVMARWA